ncbi:MAG: hypothetical protein E7Z89_05315 [Cyanobacteria bacterium SIG28]|nr:hypothetical protein [Cyanobacteria bacterium SIG28]
MGRPNDVIMKLNPFPLSVDEIKKRKEIMQEKLRKRGYCQRLLEENFDSGFAQYQRETIPYCSSQRKFQLSTDYFDSAFLRGTRPECVSKKGIGSNLACLKNKILNKGETLILNLFGKNKVEFIPEATLKKMFTAFVKNC